LPVLGVWDLRDWSKTLSECYGKVGRHKFVDKEAVMKILLKYRPPLSIDDVLAISNEIAKVLEVEEAEAVAKTIQSKKPSRKS